MWVACESSISKERTADKPYHYFSAVAPYGFIACSNSLQELIDHIRNPEDAYHRLHLENTTGVDGEADENGVKYYLTIKSICYGYKVEFELYDLDDIENCEETSKAELKEVKEWLNNKER